MMAGSPAALTLPGAGRQPPLTSRGVPPLEGRHVIRYLGGSWGAGVQDRWTLEEVTWVKTRLVGVKTVSRAGVAAAGVTVGGKEDGQWPVGSLH